MLVNFIFILVTVSSDCSLKLWNLEKNKESVLGSHEDYAKKVCLLNQNNIVSSGLDGITCIWDVEKKTCIKLFDNDVSKHAGIYSLTSIDNIIFTGSNDKVLFDLFKKLYLPL